MPRAPIEFIVDLFSSSLLLSASLLPARPYAILTSAPDNAAALPTLSAPNLSA